MARNKYDVDEVLEDKFDLNQLKRLLAYLIPYRKRFVSVGFMMLSASAFTMLIPQFFQNHGKAPQLFRRCSQHTSGSRL